MTNLRQIQGNLNNEELCHLHPTKMSFFFSTSGSSFVVPLVVSFCFSFWLGELKSFKSTFYHVKIIESGALVERQRKIRWSYVLDPSNILMMSNKLSKFSLFFLIEYNNTKFLVFMDLAIKSMWKYEMINCFVYERVTR